MRKLIAAILAIAVLLISAPALANGRQDYIPGLDPSLRRYIQQRLKDEGFYRGPVDGQIGSGSRQAIIAFREAKGLNECVEVEGECVEELNMYLTPKLIEGLFGITMGSGTDEIDTAQQRQLISQLRRRPANTAVGPDE